MRSGNDSIICPSSKGPDLCNRIRDSRRWVRLSQGLFEVLRRQARDHHSIGERRQRGLFLMISSVRHGREEGAHEMLAVRDEVIKYFLIRTRESRGELVGAFEEGSMSFNSRSVHPLCCLRTVSTYSCTSRG